MFGATQMPFHGKKYNIKFKQCISVNSVGKGGEGEPGLGFYPEVGARPGLLPRGSPSGLVTKGVL